MKGLNVEATKTTIRDRLRWKWQDTKRWVQVKIRDRLIRVIGGVPGDSDDSNYLSHAKREFICAGWMDKDGKFKDDMQEMICNNVLDLLRVFGNQGHSGSSAPYAINLAKRLLEFNPIAPLTGEDSEWMSVYDDTYQNNRCSSVFKKGKDGNAYWIDGRVFREPDGGCYTGSGSRVDVVFPWVKPEKPEYVDVDKDGNVLEKKS